jgi:hypothetical protein
VKRLKAPLQSPSRRLDKGRVFNPQNAVRLLRIANRQFGRVSVGASSQISSGQHVSICA